jgi:hypothetical protein
MQSQRNYFSSETMEWLMLACVLFEDLKEMRVSSYHTLTVKLKPKWATGNVYQEIIKIISNVFISWS